MVLKRSCWCSSVAQSASSLRSDNVVFITTTYSRDNLTLREAWLRAVSDSNRYIQKLSRQFAGHDLWYLRTLEYHRDGYPHAHYLLGSNNLRFRDRGKYVIESMRTVLRSSWSHGLVDCQCPLGKGRGVIGYVLKYVTKSSSSNRLWASLLYQLPETPQGDGSSLRVPAGAAWKLLSVPDRPAGLFACHFRWRKIKLVTWSRDFVPNARELLK